MHYLISFNESYIRNLTGTLLLTTLLSISNVAKGQYNKNQIEQKAELSRLNKNEVLDIMDSLYKKGFVDHQVSKLDGDDFLFTTNADARFSQAVSVAAQDADLKMKYLGKSGKQYILKLNKLNTWKVIIITEIMDEDEPMLYDRESDTRKW